MAAEQREIWLAGAPIERSRHVCAFFRTADEHYSVLLPFMKEGIERGELAFHLVNPALRQDHLRRLEWAGIDLDAAERSGQLEVRVWQEACLRGGHFDQDAMLALIQEILDSGKARGFPLTRWVAQMEWALEDRPGLDSFVEFETRVNYLQPRYDDPLICAYDLTKFGAGIVMDVLRTHPMVIVGGILQENPFFVPPDQFLRELRGRSSPRAPA